LDRLRNVAGFSSGKLQHVAKNLPGKIPSSAFLIKLQYGGQADDFASGQSGGQRSIQQHKRRGPVIYHIEIQGKVDLLTATPILELGSDIQDQRQGGDPASTIAKDSPSTDWLAQ
jgi:hypothetical protein